MQNETLYTNPEVALPKRPMPAPVAAKVTETQYAALSVAIISGPDALLAFAKREQIKRNSAARLTWQHYRLFTLPGNRFPSLIVNPLGVPYAHKTTSEGVTRFEDCPDQVFVDAVNEALRDAGIELFRLETKHRKIWELKEEWARASGICWQSVGGRWVEA